MGLMEYVIDLIVVNDEIEEILENHGKEGVKYILQNKNHYLSRLIYDSEKNYSSELVYKALKTKTFSKRFPELGEFVKNRYKA